MSKIHFTGLFFLATVANNFGACENTPLLSQQHKPMNDKKIHIIVKNKNTKDLSLLVKPELPKTTYSRKNTDEKVGWIILTIPGAFGDSPSVEAEFNVTPEQLGDFDYYSITGETNPLTPTGTCYNLQMGKSYIIEFENNLFGTSCTGIELTNLPPNNNDSLRILPASKVMPNHKTGAVKIPERPSLGLAKKNNS